MKIEKLSKDEMKKTVELYQKYYPGKTLYFTEDGNCFLDKNPAVDHANKTNQEWSEVKPKEDKTKDSEKTAEMTEQEAKEQLLALEINEKIDFAQAGKIIKVLKLTPSSKKHADILVALDEAQKELKKLNHIE